jgi:uncharacterized protein YcaQ
MTPLHLSADDARRLALRAQLLVGSPDRRAGVPGVLRRLGAVQLDTISVLARSHELVAYARLGAVGRSKVERAYWGRGDTFEYWAHAASVLPLEQWPLFAFRRRHFRQRHRVWEEHHAPTAEKVLARVRAEGPLTASDLGGAKESAQWWGWSDVKRAAEYLLAAGELICATRTGWRRVYDLPERVVPTDLLHDDLDDDACVARLVRTAAAALGVATAADLADYFRLQTRDVVRLVPETGLAPVAVAGWKSPAWADPALIESATPRGRHRVTLLSPFDSLVWDRKRTARLFGFDHRLEAYVPKDKREHGYFTMPVLAGGRLVARVDPARDNGVLVARQVTIEPQFATPRRVDATAASIAAALKEAAQWVGCDAIAIKRVKPDETAAILSSAIDGC